jgi:dienelactone hydrolase
LSVRNQLADWHAAIAFAATLPGVDRNRIALWAYSASAGYLFEVAAHNPGVTAVIAQAPHADGPAGPRNAASHQKPLAMLRFTGRGVRDALRGLVDRRPLLVPLVS